MKFSACCTTQSRFGLVAVVVLAALFSADLSAAPVQQEAAPPLQGPVAPVPSQTPALPTVENFVAANTLQEEGKTPFHLLMTFQLFDLAGKPSEQGTLEYWWAGPAGFHLDITSPSLGTLHNVREDEVPAGAARRSLYLVNELLNDMRFPASSLGRLKGPAHFEKRDFKSMQLECLGAPSPTSTFSSVAVCEDGTSGTVRLILGQEVAITRNRVGRFAGTHVALDLAILWEGRDAITGHVEKLESFHPETSEVVLTKPAAASASKTPVKPYAGLAGGVIAGNKIGGEPPRYPITARQERLQGTVVLIAEISPQGDIVDLFPIASPDERLSQSATDAVKTWKYRPYTLNGVPTEVSTTITVHFNLTSTVTRF